MLYGPATFLSPIDDDRSESSLLTLSPFQRTSQTLPSRLSAPTSQNNPSDATSHTLATPPTKIRIRLVCTIPRAAPPALKFISLTGRL